MRKNAIYFLNKLKSNVNTYKPEILIGFGIAGFIATAIIAAKSAITTRDKIEFKRKMIAKEENIREEDVSNKEFIKDIAIGCIPPVIMGAASTGLIISGTKIKSKRSSALATALVLAETTAREYQEKIIETIGEKKEERIRNEITESKISNDDRSTDPKNVFITQNGSMRCYERMSDRYFTSDIEKIKRSVNNLNKRMLDEMYISLNEFYEELGLPSTTLGNLLGWNRDNGLIELEYSSHLAPDGVPCLAIDYNRFSQPIPDFTRL